jgi:histidine triad (HIT) family protein
MDCTFCRLLDGGLPSWPVYEDDVAVALLDIAQVTRGHTLVIPRRHAEDVWALSEDEAAAVMKSVHRVAGLLRVRLLPAGLNITQANGRAAWQEVFHYHVHLVPRYRDDGLAPPWRSTSPSPEFLTEVRAEILD